MTTRLSFESRRVVVTRRRKCSFLFQPLSSYGWLMIDFVTDRYVPTPSISATRHTIALLDYTSLDTARPRSL